MRMSFTGIGKSRFLKTSFTSEMKLPAMEVPPEKTIEIGSVKLGMFSADLKRSAMFVMLYWIRFR